MPIDVQKWEKRILEDYEKITSRHQKWIRARNLMNNEDDGDIYGNIAHDFARNVKARLLRGDFFVRVSTDDPDFSSDAEKVTVMSNSLARTVGLKTVIDDATQESLWAGTSWLEIGHSFDVHSFDPARTIHFKNPNTFNAGEIVDEYEEISEAEVSSILGEEIESVPEFDPFTPPPEPEEPKPLMTFDPNSGSPWIKTASPFSISLPVETVKFEEADYVTKFVILSKRELEQIVNDSIPDGAEMEISRFASLIDETPGAKYIDNKHVVAITYIRRDRNNPEYSSWYLAHVVGHPDIVLKSAPNPYGGLIPLIPVRTSTTNKIISKSWIENLEPYAKGISDVIEGIFKRIKRGLTFKWGMPAGSSVDKTNENRINSTTYTGQIKFESGTPETWKPLEIPIVTTESLQAINLLSQLAQSKSGQSDFDRATPVKKISARQTEALIDASSTLIGSIRAPVVKAGEEAILKLIHMLSLFSAPREHIYTFGKNIVTLSPGGNDYTTSYQYEIDITEVEGAADAEKQLLIVQFLSRVAAMPQFADKYDWLELANEARRAFGFSVKAMAPQQNQPGMPGMQNPGQPELSMLDSREHPERLPGDQGNPDIANMLGALDR